MIRDGIDPKSALYPNLGERAWWLREIVAAVPPREWLRRWQAPLSEIVAAVTGGEWKHVLGPSWMNRRCGNRDASWRSPLPESAQDKSLGFGDLVAPVRATRLMPPERREAFVLQRLRADPARCGQSIRCALGFVCASKQTCASVHLVREFPTAWRPFSANARRNFLRIRSGKRPSFVYVSGIHIDYKYHDFDIAGMIEGLAAILPFARLRNCPNT